MSRVAELSEGLDRAALGAAMLTLAEELYPLPRSITGDGVRETLRRIDRLAPLEVTEVPSGTEVLDWVVPPEWNLRRAYLDGPGGRVLDTRDHLLHVVGYSVPVDVTLSREELAAHVYTLPDRPSWIPYRTSYYERRWGLCMAHAQWSALPEGRYHVHIDATLEPGSLTYGEHVHRGATRDEVLFSTHVCHPQLANDNLSGIVTAAYLAHLLADIPTRLTYRFLFCPGTIGAIAWLARNEPRLGHLRHGLVITGVGDPGVLHYKRSRRGDAAVDHIVPHVLATSGRPFEVLDFTPYGYDERQFCSPGFDLPVGRLSRTPHGTYPEYHTSADDLSFIDADQLADTVAALLEVVEVFEGDGTYLNLQPKGEPQLGRRGLYRAVGGDVDSRAVEVALLWVLNLSDGSHRLIDIARRAQLPFRVVRRAADALLDAGLLAPVVSDGGAGAPPR